MFTNRRPYYGLKMSTTDFFREPVRYLKESNTQESMMEKPYLEDEYPKMHLKLPGFSYKAKEIPSVFGPIADGDTHGGLAFIDFGEAKCRVSTLQTSGCANGGIIVTLTAEYLWTAEFDFSLSVVGDSPGITITKLPETEGGARDKQDYQVSFPTNYSGSTTVCGSAVTNTLISQTFKTVVAGMPVGIYFTGNSFIPIERGQQSPAVLVKSTYGAKGDSCGCVTLDLNCPCSCKNIGYTTQQMGASETQTLTVEEPVAGCVYVWNIASGGGSWSSSESNTATGISVEYIAPDSNAECENNPTITLSTSGIGCDTLDISVNQYAVQIDAYRIDNACTVSCHKNCGSSGLCGLINCTGHPDKYCGGCTLERYGCDDVLRSSAVIYANNNILDAESCSSLMASHCGASSTVDLRTQDEIDAGCCPAGLL